MLEARHRLGFGSSPDAAERPSRQRFHNSRRMLNVYSIGGGR
jgi:hypothetical protein